MKSIQELKSAYLKFKFESTSIDGCVKWAEDRLVRDEENVDQDVILLAGATDKEEVDELVKRILARYLGVDTINDEYCCGQYLVGLHDKYKRKEITINRLESILWKLFCGLSYPAWLIMLSRNCEYATDVDNFVEPFEREFDYIAGLWQSVSSVSEFRNQYSREISNSHDVK